MNDNMLIYIHYRSVQVPSFVQWDNLVLNYPACSDVPHLFLIATKLERKLQPTTTNDRFAATKPMSRKSVGC